jgi:hypothetical protein
LLIAACAKQGFPPGGPEDKTPPFVIRTEPAQGAVRVPSGRDVRVWFSETVRSSISSDAVFISPNPGEGVRFQWSGARLAVRFPKPFHDSAAVVITLGTGIQDLRGNAMKSSFTLAFTTGTVLDSGRVTGRAVGTGSALGLDVWAYRLAGGDPDPGRTEPEYAVQCRDNGDFLFSHLPDGSYRIFAVRDRARDRLYQPVEDEIGVAFRDAVLSPQNQNRDSVFFRMAREDTLGPSLVRASAPHAREMILQFNEAVATAVPPRVDAPDDTLIEKTYVDPTDNRRIVLLTTPQRSPKSYSIGLAGVTDAGGNPPDSSSQHARIDGSDRADTTLPRLVSVEPKNGQSSVPLDCRARLVFSAAMDSGEISIMDGTGKTVPCRTVWDTPASLTLIPESQLSGRTRYRLELRSPARGRSGRAVKDSTVSFSTLNADTLSEISGMVRGSGSALGPLVIEAKQAGMDSLIYRYRLSEPGPYRLEHVLPGKYILQCYRDRDGDGRYGYGKAHPFKPSELFSVSYDTIRVRSRWPNEGNDLVLP